VSVAPERSAGNDAPSFEAVLARLKGVDGWLSDGQARRLWEAARAVRAPGRIVEIGSFRGRSTIILALAAAPGVEVVAIDPHGGGDRGPQEITPDTQRGDEDFALFHRNLQRAGVEDRVNHVRETSLNALDFVSGDVDVLYVDGAHRYAPARADVERWGERVVSGGTMLIHDCFNAIGVTLAQARLLFTSSQWRYRGRSGSLADYRRETLSAGQRLGNAGKQLAGLPYFVRNMAVKVYLVARGRQGDGIWPY
jgi:predicted O-methyltransferase YrrM